MIKSANAFKEYGPFRKITLLYDTSVEIALLTEYIDYHRYMNNSLIFPKNRTNVKFVTGVRLDQSATTSTSTQV